MPKTDKPRGYSNLIKVEDQLKNDDPELWEKRGQRRALRLFHEMAERVPAYKDFLQAHEVDHKQVKNLKDFEKVPTIDKDNYLRKYPKHMLCWDGKFAEGSWVISATSGSSGEPYYFPRSTAQDWHYSLTAELYLRTNFNIDKLRTLYIVAFPMGAWIGGVFTYEAVKTVAERGNYDLSIITPGIHKTEVINAFKQLAGSYDQVIIGAYAPFLKDILDDGTQEGVNWKEHNVKFIFSAEVFSETFRDYVTKTVGLKNVYLDTLNHYGTVDMGTMAHETPLSILIRRRLFEEGKQTSLLPEEFKQPTLCQYNPEQFYFESDGSNLLCTAYSGLPLVRYNLKDYGGVLAYNDVIKRLNGAGIKIKKEVSTAKISGSIWQLPFVYVYERTDFSVSYYAFNVYPDPVRHALHDDKFEQKVTGKFSMEVAYTKQGRQHLFIHVELKNKVVPSRHLQKDVQEKIHTHLMKYNSEYPELFRVYGNKVKPTIKLYKYEDPTYFKIGAKQKWVIK